MTAIADKLSSKAIAAIAKLGAAGSIVIQNDTYAAGVVSGTPTTVAVTLVGPVDESRRYAATGADTRVTATFYVAADGLTVIPTNADRIVFGSRTYVIVATQPSSIQGVTVAYRFDVGEIGNG